MIRGKGNLGCNYWCNHLPTEFEITPWERELLREYYLQDLGMIPEQELDYQSKELIKLSLMICKHLVWELFDWKKKHRGSCQINGLNPQCLWVNCGVERTTIIPR